MTPGSNRPGWDDDPTVPTWPGYEPLVGDEHADACVVGLGGSGLAAIEELTGRGLSVIGVDAGRVAAGAAGRNGGFLCCGGAMSIDAIPRELYAALYRDTQREQHLLAERLGNQVIRHTGSLTLAGLPGAPVDPAEEQAALAQAEAVRTEQAALASIGVAVEAYDGKLGQGYFNPDSAVMNPVRRAFGLASMLPRTARLHEQSPVTRVESGRVHTDQGSVTAEVVIVAVDGKLEALLPQLAGLVQTVRLQMVATAPITSGRVPCAVGYRDGFEWAQQDAADRLLIGGGRDHFMDDETTVEDEPTDPVQQWIDSAAARVAGEPVRVTHRWAASAGYTPDRRALCLPVEEGVVACGGYSGSGNLVGPVAARAAVALALDGVTPPAYLRSSPTP